MKLPISAIVVGYNEANLLIKSLPKLNFCDEILYFDLGSTDNSKEVAKANNAKIIEHEIVPICECIHAKYFQTTKHTWVLFIDPDEVLSQDLTNDIKFLFNENPQLEKNIGCIMVPWIFHFKGYKLKGTIWGGIRSKVLIINNQRVDYEPLVHIGKKLKENYDTLEIPSNGSNSLNHYWMIDYKRLIEKHLRYLKNEGEARYKSGQRAQILTILMEPIKAFRYSYFDRRGFKDGLTGIFLSLFWAWYETIAIFQLYKYQIEKSKNITN